MLHPAFLEWNPLDRLAALFEVTQAGVDDFFDTAEFGTPEITHVVEAAVHGIESGGDMRGKKAKRRD